jgi:Na+/H+ antiporter NhaD/arsenite permease-like protein
MPAADECTQGNRMRLLHVLALPGAASAGAGGVESASMNFHLTDHPIGWIALVLFVLAYAAVIAEERIQIAKSKPVLLAAALIWGMLAWKIGAGHVENSPVKLVFEGMFLEYAELFFFLVVAMTYVTAMGERGVFEALRAQITRRHFSYR